MSGAAAKIKHSSIEPAAPVADAAGPQDSGSAPAQGGDGSPVHGIHARLEEAVFASFSAKEAAAPPRATRNRAVALVVGAAVGGWALLMGGVALKLL